MNQEYSFDVTSGKIIISNDLSGYLEQPDSFGDIFSVASFYENINVFNPYVGNTELKFKYLDSDKKTLSFIHDLDYNENINEKGILGTVSIDDRFLTIVDYDTLKKLIELSDYISEDYTFDDFLEENDCTTLEVKNGKYTGFLNCEGQTYTTGIALIKEKIIDSAPKNKIKFIDIFSIQDRIQENIKNGKIKVNFNGHFESKYQEEDGIPSYFKRDLMHSIRIMELRKNEALLKIVEDASNGVEVEPFPFAKLEKNHACSNCNSDVILWCNGKEFFIKDACNVDFAPFDVFIPVPSGKVLVDNDFREYFTAKDNFDINQFYGLLETTKSYAKEFMFHTFVGNSCPSFKTTADDKSNLLFGNWQYDEEGEEIDGYDASCELGSVCTDLWWVSVIDHDVLKRRFELMGISDKFEEFVKHCDVVDVKKGWYKSTSHFPINGYDCKTYAEMTHVSDISNDVLGDVGLNSPKVENLDFKNIPIIKNLVEDEYASIRPSLSVVLFDKLITLETSHNKKNWFPYYYADHKIEDEEDKYVPYMEIVNNQKTFLSIMENVEFFIKIPSLDKDYFLLSKPDSHFKFHSCSWYLGEKTFPWAGAFYKYDVSKYDLAFIFILFKAIWENKEHDAIRKYYKDNAPEFIDEKLLFTLNMAYTNIVEREMETEMLSVFEEIQTPENWNIVKGFSPALVDELKSDFEFTALQMKTLNKWDDKTTNDFIEQKLTNAMLWHSVDDPDLKLKALKERVQKKINKIKK